MEQDMISILSEPGALAFVSRRCWHLLPEHNMHNLGGYVVNSIFRGTASVFLLLANPLPLSGKKGDFHLVRICQDEEGKLILEDMELTAAEAAQVKQTETLWE